MSKVLQHSTTGHTDQKSHFKWNWRVSNGNSQIFQSLNVIFSSMTHNDNNTQAHSQIKREWKKKQLAFWLFCDVKNSLSVAINSFFNLKIWKWQRSFSIECEFKKQNLSKLKVFFLFPLLFFFFFLNKYSVYLCLSMARPFSLILKVALYYDRFIPYLVHIFPSESTTHQKKNEIKKRRDELMQKFFFSPEFWY